LDMILPQDLSFPLLFYIVNVNIYMILAHIILKTLF